MKTITLEAPGRFSMSETDAPTEAAPGQALVRVRRVGICGTDLHAFRGRQPFFTYPRILGHELACEVVQAPVESGLAPGDHCAVEPYLSCGRCIACRRARPNCCAHLQVLGVHTDGGMRELVQVPAEKLHRSTRLSLDQLALVETLGIGAHAVARAALEPGETALVVGAGPIGLSVMQFALAAGARVIVRDVNPARLRFCQEQLGVEAALPGDGDPLEALHALTGGDLATAVFDATGSAASMQDSFRFVANSGCLIFVGLVQADVAFNDPEFHRRELSILATRNSTPDDFRRIIALIEAGDIDTRPWITHRAGCDEMIARFPGWGDPASGVIKAMVEF